MTNANLTFPAENLRGNLFPTPVSKAFLSVKQAASKAKDAIVYASSGRELRPTLSSAAIVTDTSAFYADMLGVIYYWESEDNRDSQGHAMCSLLSLMSFLKRNRTTIVPVNYKDLIRSGLLTKEYLKEQLLYVYNWSYVDIAKTIQFINRMQFIG